MAADHSHSIRARTLGAVLIVIVGLLNFHLPHFVLERAAPATDTPAVVELVFVANLVGALVAAGAIWRNHNWGWLLGLVIVGVSFLLYLAQETVGLPGFPQNWWEPSRIVALVIDALFVLLAWNQVTGLYVAPKRGLTFK